MDKSIFDERAAQWDTPQRIKLADAVLDAMKARIVFSRDMDILDFAAGTGLISMGLHDRVKNITALDSSAGMLDVLNEKLKLHSISNVHTIAGDERSVMGMEGRFNCVVSSMALHHVEVYEELLRVLHSALKRDGVLLLADLAPEDGDFHGDNTGVFHNGFDRVPLGSAMEKAGFRNYTYDIIYSMTRTMKNGEEKDFSVFMAHAVK